MPNFRRCQLTLDVSVLGFGRRCYIRVIDWGHSASFILQSNFASLNPLSFFLFVCQLHTAKSLGRKHRRVTTSSAFLSFGRFTYGFQPKYYSQKATPRECPHKNAEGGRKNTAKQQDASWPRTVRKHFVKVNMLNTRCADNARTSFHRSSLCSMIASILGLRFFAVTLRALACKRRRQQHGSKELSSMCVICEGLSHHDLLARLCRRFARIVWIALSKTFTPWGA